MLVLSLIGQSLTVGFLIVIAVYDARHLRIPNPWVLAMLVLYLLSQGPLGFPFWKSDLLIGAVLFGLGFVMWMLRSLGAGDAKLMLPLGMHLGLAGATFFAVALLMISVLFFLAIQIAGRTNSRSALGQWLATMKSSGKVPYGVPLAIAAVPVLVAKLIVIA